MVLEAFAGSGGAFLITFREALEAALIIGIIAAYLVKTNKGELRRYLSWGAGAAIAASAATAGALAVFYGGLSGAGETLFEGTAAILATGVLTYMIFWMAKHSRRVKEHLQEKVGVALSRGSVVGIFVIAFIAVFREGIETVLFLTALGTRSFLPTVLGASIGIAVVALLTILMMKRIYTLNLHKVFTYSSILLIIFAAGLFASGVHEYLEVAEDGGIQTGVLSAQAYNINPPEGDIFHEKGSVGGIITGLVGYDGNPEWGRVLAYLGYWVVVGGFFMRTHSKRKIFKSTG